MPNDLNIQVVAQPNTGNSSATPVKAAAMAVPVEQTAPVAMAEPNPTLALNAALGLVVIEFRNSAGSVVSTIPTAQQIQAYKQWQDSGNGQPPSLGTTMTTPVPASAPGPAAAPASVRSQTSAPAPAPVHAPAPAAFDGNAHSTHLGIGVW